MPKPVAHKGFVERQGYMHAEPFALRWFVKDNPNPLEGFLAYMSREDMHFVLDLPESEKKPRPDRAGAFRVPVWCRNAGGITARLRSAAP